MIRKLFLNLTLVTLATICLAQDSIRVDSEISIVTKGQHNLAVLVNNSDCINCRTGKIDDNPFFHLAIYTGIDYKLILNKKYTLETGLYLEERSHSGGNNTLSNIVIYPKIKIEALDSFVIGNSQFSSKIIGGDFWNEDVDDFLRLYNIDYQGLLGSISWNNFYGEFMTVGDLSKNVGLDLPQTYRFAIGYKNRRLKNATALTFNELSVGSLSNHVNGKDFNVSNYTKYQVIEKVTVAFQAELRINDELPVSTAVGAKAMYSSKNFQTTVASRYYSSDFNLGYNGRQPRYSGGRDIFVGPQLYPLRNFYRDLSQWALYTHMQNKDLLALEITANWKHQLYRNFDFFTELDINYIQDLTNSENTILPSYIAGIQVNFLTAFSGRVSLTNKHMELTNFYQTYAISRKPYLSLGVNMQIDKIRLKPTFVK